MAGYNGYSMSNNAAAAYNSGEKPLSKWTKIAIFEEITENCDIPEEKMTVLQKMTVKELKKEFLHWSSWHHTSKMYNCTDFYSLVFERIEEITIAEIEDIIANRKKSSRRPKEVIETEKTEKVARKAEKEVRAEKERLFKYQTKYKSLSGFMRSNSVDLDKLRKVRLERIAERRAHLQQAWEKQNYEYGLSQIDDDLFIESYIR